MHACAVSQVAGVLACLATSTFASCATDSDWTMPPSPEALSTIDLPTLDASADSAADAGNAPPRQHVSDACERVPLADAGVSDGGADRLNDSSLPPYTIHLVGVGFDDHEGTSVHAALVRSAEDRIVIEGSMRIYKGQFGFTWSQVLSPGVAYHVDYFCDLNGNGLCDQPPTDHVMRERLPVVHSDVALKLTHSNRQNPAACVAF